MPERRDGSIIQSCLRFEQGDWGHEFISHPVLGVVLNVFVSDDDENAETRTYQDQRGTQLQARVLVVNDGHDHPWILPNVIITPPGGSGFDNFSEEVPRGTTGTVDGTAFDWSFLDIPPRKLNGDFCVVDFIGGSTNQPFMITWWPHPANRRDSTTGGEVETVGDLREGNLQQGRRLVKRFQGTRFSVTSQGDIFIDTTQAGSTLDENGERKKVDDGGEIDITLKDTQQLQVNFNQSVAEEDSATGDIFVGHPDALQPNPPVGTNIRDDLLTRLLMDKDFITALAGRVMRIAGDNDETDNVDTVLLGQTPSDHVVKGETHQVTYNDLVSKLNAFEATYEDHIHGSQNGNTTAPIDPSTSDATYANPCFPVLNVPPGNPVYIACNLPPAGPLTGDLGGPEFIIDQAQAAQAAAATTTPVVVPPPADGVTRVDPMPDDDLSDVVKTE